MFVHKIKFLPLSIELIPIGVNFVVTPTRGIFENIFLNISVFFNLCWKDSFFLAGNIARATAFDFKRISFCKFINLFSTSVSDKFKFNIIDQECRAEPDILTIVNQVQSYLSYPELTMLDTTPPHNEYEPGSHL